MVNTDSDIRLAIEGIFLRYSKKGYLVFYLDEGDRVKFTGNMSLSALAPMLMEWVIKRGIKKGD